MIHVQNLQFQYPNKSLLLDIPEFQVATGERVFLYGPSGSGKTTFLEILSGISEARHGKVQVNGLELSQMNSKQRDDFRAKNIGMIFQSFNLIPFLSVQQNIELPHLFHNEVKNRDSLREIVRRLGLEKLLQQKATELSVGQQQRVAVARTLFQSPRIILADEPTSALDYDHRENFLKLLFELAQELKITILFVSHDRTLAQLFDRQVSLLELNRVPYDLA